MENSTNQVTESLPCPCHTTKQRSEKEYKALMHRLARISGQVRGVQGMIEKDAYCVDILTQIAAIQAALNGLSREILESHIRTCVANDLRAGRDEIVDELMDTLRKFMK